MRIYRLAQWKEGEEYLSLLDSVKYDLVDMWSMGLDSEADLLNDIQIAIKFIEYAQNNPSRENIKKALEKAFSVMDQGTDYEDAEQLEIIYDMQVAIEEL